MGNPSTLKLVGRVKWAIVAKAESDERKMIKHLGTIKVLYLARILSYLFIKLLEVTECR